MKPNTEIRLHPERGTVGLTLADDGGRTFAELQIDDRVLLDLLRGKTAVVSAWVRSELLPKAAS